MPQLVLNPTYSVSVRNGSASKFTGFAYAGPTDNDPPLRLYRCGWKFSLASLPVGATINSVTLDLDVDSAGTSGNTWSIGAYGGDGAGDIETDDAATIHTGFDVSADNYISTADFTSTGVKNLTLTGAAADLLAQAGSTFCLGCRQNAEDTQQTAAFLDITTTVPVLTIDYTEASSSASIDVTIPSDIDLKWDTTYQLAVTHDGGTTTLDNVTLSAPAGWETVTLTSLNPNAGIDYLNGDIATVEYHARTDATLGGGGYTANVGDVFAFTMSNDTLPSLSGVSFDGQTIPLVAEAATVSLKYKAWDDTNYTWTAESTLTITDKGVYSGGGGGDTTAPTLSTATAQALSFIAGSGSVSTNEGNGTLYFYVSANASENAATVKSGSSQTVSASGSQAVSLSGLSPETTYYAHYLHRDAAGNDSSVVSTSSFSTPAIPAPSAGSDNDRLYVKKNVKRKAKYEVKQSIIKRVH